MPRCRLSRLGSVSSIRVNLPNKNYDPAKGYPIFTGPYKLASVSETEFTYVRDDNWWGAKAGFKPLPEGAPVIPRLLRKPASYGKGTGYPPEHAAIPAQPGHRALRPSAR